MNPGWRYWTLECGHRVIGEKDADNAAPEPWLWCPTCGENCHILLPHDRAGFIADHLRRYPGLTNGDLERKLGCSRRQIAQTLIDMEAEGTVRFEKEPCEWSRTRYRVRWYVR